MVMKKKRMRTVVMFYALVSLLLITGSCRKELYYGQENGEGHTVEVDITWPSGITAPEGARVLFYPKDGGSPLVYNISASGDKVCVPEGTYDVVLFNNDTEYVKLYETAAESTLEARTTTVVKSGEMKSFPSQDIVNMPDLFYSYKINNFRVTSGSASDILKATPQPRVKTFKVKVLVGGTGGMSCVSSGTGFISTVYGSYFPGTEAYPTTDSAIYFNFDNKQSTYMEGTVRTFGIDTSTGKTQIFKLVLTLTDGSTTAYECDITNQLNVDLSTGEVLVTIPTTINISAGTPSGFNVTVTGWDDSTDVNL